MLEIHKLPGMQHEQNSTHPASLSCCNAGKHTAFCFCKVCKNFDHESSLLIALISAFISFRLLVNMVFRDSGRSLSACCLPDCPWRSFSSFSFALCVSGCLFPVFLFQTEIPFPLLLAKGGINSTYMPNTSSAHFNTTTKHFCSRTCHDFPLPLPLPTPTPVPVLVLLSLLGFTAPTPLFSSLRSAFSSAFVLSSALTSRKW